MASLGRVVLGAALLAGMACTASCLLTNFSVGEIAGDAGADAGVDAEAGTSGCPRATYPDPPNTVDDPNANISFVLAIHAIDMGDSGSTPGYDLDHTCTCYADAGESCLSGKPHCDAPGGVDNSAAGLFKLIQLGLGTANFGSDFYSAMANDGGWSVLIQVNQYNGGVDDPSVQVALYPSPGLAAPANWDGFDEWPVTASAVGPNGINDPIYKSDGAYITNNVLVATLPTASITLAGGINTITLTLTDGVLTGNIEEVNGQYSLTNGVIAARWTIADVFNALSSYRDNDGKPICTDMGFAYSTAKGAVCNGADIQSNGNAPKSKPCDSISFGIGIKADPALLGAVEMGPVPTPGCPPATDPANDSCP